MGQYLTKFNTVINPLKSLSEQCLSCISSPNPNCKLDCNSLCNPR